jgi:hypothetical protein
MIAFSLLLCMKNKQKPTKTYKASQEGTLQRHPGIELFFNIPRYGGYDLGCHRRFPFYPRRDFHPVSRARITEGCVAYVLNFST